MENCIYTDWWFIFVSMDCNPVDVSDFSSGEMYYFAGSRNMTDGVVESVFKFSSIQLINKSNDI